MVNNMRDMIIVAGGKPSTVGALSRPNTARNYQSRLHKLEPTSSCDTYF
ncbi:MAG: hypothetical protein ACI8XZ_003150 [Gammaproteobacteria bacterium]|jgi:hypothetical protein